MKLIGFYTRSHEILAREWFIPSLKDSFDLDLRLSDGDLPGGGFEYGTPGFAETVKAKIDLILETLHNHWGQCFVYSDMDIQFFRPVRTYLADTLRKYDLVIQRDSPSGALCTGFFACQANERVHRVWQDVRRLMEERGIDDQEALNGALCGTFGAQRLNRIQRFLAPRLSRIRNRYGLQWNYLPGEFFSGGNNTGRVWEPGKALHIPSGIVLHHANWTVGVPNKLAQLRYVKERFFERDSSS